MSWTSFLKYEVRNFSRALIRFNYIVPDIVVKSVSIFLFAHMVPCFLGQRTVLEELDVLCEL